MIELEKVKKNKFQNPLRNNRAEGDDAAIVKSRLFAVTWSSTFIFMTKIIAMLRVWAKIIL